MSKYKVGNNCTISDKVEIGDGCVIGNNVTIYEKTVIGKNVRIDDNTVIGKLPMKSVISATTSDVNNLSGANIGDGSIIGTNVVIYAGCEIGNDCLIADFSSIREDAEIGSKTTIGSKNTIENKVRVGSRCKLQTGVHLVPYTTVGNDVFIAPNVNTANDRYLGRTEKRKKEYAGPTIEDGARIGLGANLFPGVKISKDALVGGGSVVTKDIPPKKVAYGVAAQVIRDVSEEELLENQ